MKNCSIAGRNRVPITNQQEIREPLFHTAVKRRLGQAARWLKYRVASRALILMYHRVTDLPNDPYLLAVRPKRFAEQMEVIRRHCIPIRLQELVDALHGGKVPNRAIVVTFDDGYADNLHHAKPLLERYEIPATVFVTAGHLATQREFWWDVIDRALLQPGTLPSRLRLIINRTPYEWELGEESPYTVKNYQRHGDWHIERPNDPTPRHRLFRVLYAAMAGLPAGERQNVVDDLLSWAGAEPSARPTHRTLTEDELVSFHEGGLVEIGGHTMTHPFLATLPAEDQHIEIHESKNVLEGILKHPVTSFAFPHGSSNAETDAIVRKDFVCACSSIADAVWRDANCFQLPRLGVRDWDQETFARWLKWWMNG
jgi:peptidoglycan/xylan/chitin deacetylase (PgdA/CDA1 family)